MISFGQEMNGTWYPVGRRPCRSESVQSRPGDIFVSLFRAAGARNVTWLWDVNCNYTHKFPVSPWWPGAKYVSWVGIDCYFIYPNDTFNDLFASTIRAVRRLTSDPVIIGETAVTPKGDESAKIGTIFADVCQYGLYGMVWFDQDQNDGLLHQDWRLEDHPAALAAFSKDATSYLRGCP